MKLLVGLGNPGREYVATRHNIGFQVIDHFSNSKSLIFNNKFRGELAVLSDSKHDKVFCLKPQTYMNLSGQSVAAVAGFYKISSSDIMVIFDDLDLPFGKLRIATKGGSGGHNGIKSITQDLGTDQFLRLKIGIGRPIHPGQQVNDHVLSGFTAEQKLELPKIIERAVHALDDFLEIDDVVKVMNRYN